jgi:cellulase/cellobiase CelA1
VTVANTGSAAIDGWALAFTLPAGQTVTSSWNTTLSGTSGAVTARNVSYNGGIPPAGSASFGFQGTYGGAFASPPAFSLNGSTCTTA